MSIGFQGWQVVEAAGLRHPASFFPTLPNEEGAAAGMVWTRLAKGARTMPEPWVEGGTGPVIPGQPDEADRGAGSNVHREQPWRA